MSPTYGLWTFERHARARPPTTRPADAIDLHRRPLVLVAAEEVAAVLDGQVLVEPELVDVLADAGFDVDDVDAVDRGAVHGDAGDVRDDVDDDELLVGPDRRLPVVDDPERRHGLAGPPVCDREEAAGEPRLDGRRVRPAVDQERVRAVVVIRRLDHAIEARQVRAPDGREAREHVVGPREGGADAPDREQDHDDQRDDENHHREVESEDRRHGLPLLWSGVRGGWRWDDADGREHGKKAPSCLALVSCWALPHFAMGSRAWSPAAL